MEDWDVVDCINFWSCSKTPSNPTLLLNLTLGYDWMFLSIKFVLFTLRPEFRYHCSHCRKKCWKGENLEYYYFAQKTQDRRCRVFFLIEFVACVFRTYVLLAQRWRRNEKACTGDDWMKTILNMSWTWLENDWKLLYEFCYLEEIMICYWNRRNKKLKSILHGRNILCQ